MGGIKLKIHPLFFLFGLYYAFTGKIFIFIIYSVVAVVHELGHSFAAAASGYRLDTVTMMPFGAVVSGNIDGLKPKDEFKIALAGPFVNIAIGLLFVATWWMFPETYAYTDVAAEANFSMALINFLPVFPLDGGRVLSSVLSQKIGKEKAYKICRILGVVAALSLFALFITSIFYTVNFTVLFFGGFVLFGALDKKGENRYVKIYSSLTQEKLKRGAVYVKHGVDKSTSVKKLISILDEDAINEIVVFDGDREIAKLSQKRINEIIAAGDAYSPIEKFLSAS
ncbi:MAG: site-2 protease family protein [Clostridia bacterium]|nr:site-2 protease family protein [Clostridia bacterium]